MGLGNLFRRHRLKKYSSPVTTGFVPLKDIRKAIVIIDAADPAYQECAGTAENFFKKNGITVEIHYTDFRKSCNRLPDETWPGHQNAAGFFRKRDISLFKMPKIKKIKEIIKNDYDLLISLSPDNIFFMEFLTKIIRARFKTGRVVFSGEPFDLVIIPSESGDYKPYHNERDGNRIDEEENIHVNQEKVLNKIIDFLSKVE